jgi:hypothetical protein
MMSLRKDKQKVLGEVFDTERVKSFLDHQAPEGTSTDFHLLEKAYRSMNIDNFITFLDLFCHSGYNIDATNTDDMTMVQVVAEHNNSDAYVDALISAGAIPNH